MPSRILDFKMDLDIRGRDEAVRLLRPFDQAHAIAREIFFKSGIEEFLWVSESIKIKVIQV